MARNRTISPDFWTMEAVIDCQPMTRLLFIGLWNFADDGGVQPLRPRTIRLQVFPGDTMANHSIRAMIDELAAQGLVRIYEVEGVEYVAIVDWAQMQRVGKRARLRYPPPEPHAEEAAQRPSRSMGDEHPADGPPFETRPAGAPQGEAGGCTGADVKEQWAEAIGVRLREAWPDGASLESMDAAETARWIGQWIAEGCDLERDVLAAVDAEPAPPVGLHALALAVNVNRSNRLALRAAA